MYFPEDYAENHGIINGQSGIDSPEIETQKVSQRTAMSEETELEQTLVEYAYKTKLLTRTYHGVQAAFGLDEITQEREKLRARVHELELENQSLKQQLDDTERRLKSQSKRARRRSLLTWVLSMFALFFSGAGINYITSDNQAAHTPGLAMIVFAFALESLSFWIANWWQD